MKLRLAFLVSLCAASTCSAILWIVPSRFSAPSASYEFTETFEGSTLDDQSNNGYDNSGWSSYQPDGANVPHTSSGALQGTYSFKASNGQYDSISRTAGFTASDTMRAFFMFKASSWGTGASYLMWIRGSGSTVVMQVALSSTGNLDIGSAQNETLATVSGLSGSGTLYYVWVEYAKGTGSNSGGKVWVSTTTTKPGSPSASFTNGSATVTASEIVVFGGQCQALIDRVIVDGTKDIGSNP